MRVGFFRRVGSYIIDIIPILSILSILFSLVLGETLKPENYDVLMEELTVINEKYGDIQAGYDTQRDNGEITEAEYTVLIDDMRTDYNEEAHDQLLANLLYLLRTFSYFYFGQGVIYLVYVLFTKGQTIGRRVLKIELQGKINVWTLFLREFIWKTGYWLLTLGVFGILLDIAMISLNKSKKAPRDFVSGTYIAHTGVEYPF